MKSGFSFFQSVVARRFCLLFLVCAVVPICVLSIVSYTKVSNQLEKQSFSRLKREAGAYGVGLFDRLIRIENELKYLGSERIRAKEEWSFSGYNQLDHITSIFNNISLVTPNSNTRTSSLYGNIKQKVINTLTDQKNPASDKSFVSFIVNESNATRFFMVVQLSHNSSNPNVIVGEILPDYLWGIGTTPILPPMTELLVYDSNGNIILSTDAFSGKEEDIEKIFESNDLRIFKYYIDDNEYLGSSVNSFFESRFQNTGWTITLSQSRADIMSALQEFTQTFPFIIILFLLIILYLTVTFIQRGLRPLEELKFATTRIARQDFSTKVNITTNDEFADLGNAFNSMGKKIETQFQTMEVVSEIEKDILSSVNKVHILSTTLSRLKLFFHCDFVHFIRESDTTDSFIKIYTTKGKRSRDLSVNYFSVSKPEKDFIFVKKYKQKLQSLLSAPSFLHFDKQKAGNAISLPIFVKDGVKRVLILGWNEEHSLDEGDFSNALQISGQLTVALSNANLVNNFENLATGTIEALARTVDAKSRWTSGHSERVAEVATKIGKAMGLPTSEIDLLTRGGLLHDIGKIGLSFHILNKPGKLTDEEYLEVQNHPSLGAKIIEPISAFKNILTIIEQHHERYDGKGYPHGLKGSEIDMKARIMAVADVWDAITSSRPYRDGMIHDKAKAIIIDGVGTHFDPQVVQSFLAIICDKK
ncbi:MAG: HD domain-containing protein [Desulfotalea sp.]